MYLLKVELFWRVCNLPPPPTPHRPTIQTRANFRQFEELTFPNCSTSKVKKKTVKGSISLTAINLRYLVNYDKQLYIFDIFTRRIRPSKIWQLGKRNPQRNLCDSSYICQFTLPKSLQNRLININILEQLARVHARFSLFRPYRHTQGVLKTFSGKFGTLLDEMLFIEI